jgi:hypothetical protein
MEDSEGKTAGAREIAGGIGGDEGLGRLAKGRRAVHPLRGTWLRAWGWCDVPEVDLKDVLPNGKLWWESVSGVEAKARELGITEWVGSHGGVLETWQQWAKRVREIAESNKVVPLRAA